MSDFNKAIKLILKHEGGYVNHPSDPGGATNYGISLRFLKDHVELGDFDNDGDVDIEDIKNMTLENAIEVYRVCWWDKFRYDRINDQTIATKVFDFSVNMGGKRAHILLQRALNRAFGLKLTEDGIIGPATLGIINQFGETGQEQALLDAYSDVAWEFYQAIMNKNPNLRAFSRGWRNRAYAINVANSLS